MRHPGDAYHLAASEDGWSKRPVIHVVPEFKPTTALITVGAKLENDLLCHSLTLLVDFQIVAQIS
jgi:hypothetical protein